jgi:hypothetical protein
MQHETPFDKLLRDALRQELVDLEPGTDESETEAVPPQVRARILRRARVESGRLLAVRIIEGAKKRGWAEADLAAEARAYEPHAIRLLRGDGDPRKLPPAVLALLLRLSGIGPAAWRQLLLQTVVSHAWFTRLVEGETIFGRTHGLDAEQRAEALGDRYRDPERALQVATRYVTEVIEAWTTLGEHGTGTTRPRLR